MRRAPVAALVSILLAAGAAAQDPWLDAARDLDGRGRTREALSRLEGEPERLAEDVEARLLYGVLLAKLGRTAEARQVYQRLIRDRPDLPEAYNNLAVLYAAAGDYDTAIEILKQGLATHSSYRTTYDNLTKVYGKLAGEAYSKALGDQRIEGEPLRLALINGMGDAASPAETKAAPVSAAEAPTPASTSVAATPAPAPAATAPAGEIEREVWRTVQSWADAWSGQRVDAYLSFYDQRFVPPGGASRSEWESLRRRRLTAPEYIKLSLALLEVERPAANRAVVHFVQSYDSDRFRDTVTKVLDLVSTDAGWRIVGERLEEDSRG